MIVKIKQDKKRRKETEKNKTIDHQIIQSYREYITSKSILNVAYFPYCTEQMFRMSVTTKVNWKRCLLFFRSSESIVRESRILFYIFHLKCMNVSWSTTHVQVSVQISITSF